MAGQTPTFKGWYPDEIAGGTKYWDGHRWTGDVRPPRRKFASKAHDGAAVPAMILGSFFLFLSFFASELNDGSVPTFGLWAVFFVLGAVGIVGGIYMFRGQGPTTQDVEQRLADEAKVAKAKRRTADVAGAFAKLGRVARPRATAPGPVPASSDVAATAQINAIRDPRTAKALTDLQNLLYTRTLTEDEFRAAKGKLLGTIEQPQQPDQFAQLEKLADLHRQGVLGDVEFATAKARVLGL